MYREVLATVLLEERTSVGLWGLALWPDTSDAVN